MFGPESGKDGWKDLTFMFDKVRITNEATCSSFLHIFATEVGLPVEPCEPLLSCTNVRLDNEIGELYVCMYVYTGLQNDGDEL